MQSNDQLPLFLEAAPSSRPSVDVALENPLAINDRHIAIGRKGIDSARQSLFGDKPANYEQQTIEFEATPPKVRSPQLSNENKRKLEHARTVLASAQAAQANTDDPDDIISRARARSALERQHPALPRTLRPPQRGGVEDSTKLSDGMLLLAEFLISGKFAEDRKRLRKLARNSAD